MTFTNFKKWLLCGSFVLFLTIPLQGQNNRLNTYHQIGWYNYFGSFKISKKIGIHTEYQFRRNNFITDWQQSLLRTGINYHLNQRVIFRLGYGWIETFPYGKIPINGFSKDFTEHRLFQMVQHNHKEGRLEISQRLMLEQRFVGQYSNLNTLSEDRFPMLNRLRYMGRFQYPLKGRSIQKNTPYFCIYDEIFIGFGKQVNVNVFDQNRLGLLLGYALSENTRIEVGYLNQTLQLGRLVNGNNVFQNNNGLIVNLNFTWSQSSNTEVPLEK